MILSISIENLNRNRNCYTKKEKKKWNSTHLYLLSCWHRNFQDIPVDGKSCEGTEWWPAFLWVNTKTGESFAGKLTWSVEYTTPSQFKAKPPIWRSSWQTQGYRNSVCNSSHDGARSANCDRHETTVNSAIDSTCFHLARMTDL